MIGSVIIFVLISANATCFSYQWALHKSFVFHDILDLDFLGGKSNFLEVSKIPQANHLVMD